MRTLCFVTFVSFANLVILEFAQIAFSVILHNLYEALQLKIIHTEDEKDNSVNKVLMTAKSMCYKQMNKS